jgi:hypothetical protein
MLIRRTEWDDITDLRDFVGMLPHCEMQLLLSDA